jgi:hypothetical protein
MTLCKAVRVFLVTSVFVASALAQDCPARAVDAYSDRVLHKFTLKVENTSDKDIKAVKFKVIFLDAVGDEHSAVVDYTISGKIGRGKKATGHYSNYLFASAEGTRTWPVKVVFTDGTVWENPNPGKECVAMFHK